MYDGEKIVAGPYCDFTIPGMTVGEELAVDQDQVWEVEITYASIPSYPWVYMACVADANDDAWNGWWLDADEMSRQITDGGGGTGISTSLVGRGQAGFDAAVLAGAKSLLIEVYDAVITRIRYRVSDYPPRNGKKFVRPSGFVLGEPKATIVNGGHLGDQDDSSYLQSGDGSFSPTGSGEVYAQLEPLSEYTPGDQISIHVRCRLTGGWAHPHWGLPGQAAFWITDALSGDAEHLYAGFNNGYSIWVYALADGQLQQLRGSMFLYTGRTIDDLISLLQSGGAYIYTNSLYNLDNIDDVQTATINEMWLEIGSDPLGEPEPPPLEILGDQRGNRLRFYGQD